MKYCSAISIPTMYNSLYGTVSENRWLVSAFIYAVPVFLLVGWVVSLDYFSWVKCRYSVSGGLYCFWEFIIPLEILHHFLR